MEGNNAIRGGYSDVKSPVQLAHIHSQMLECYRRGKKAVKRVCGSWRNLGAAFLESLRRDPLPEPAPLRQLPEQAIHIRFGRS